MYTVPDNCIVLTRVTSKPGRISIRSKSEFFKNELVVKVTGDSIIFRRAGIDERRTRKPSSAGAGAPGWHVIEVNADFPAGRYYFDPDESDCDKIVVYCTE